MLEGNSVRLGDLGSFRPTLNSKGADTATEVTASNIEKVMVRYSPSAKLRHYFSSTGDVRYQKVVKKA